MSRAVGVDVGGTGTCAVLVDEAGGVLRRLGAPTPATEGPAAVLALVARLVRDLDPGEGLAVGVGAAGVLDASGRVVAATSAMPGWAGTDVPVRLAALLPRPARVAALNDVHAFVLAESRLGAAAGLSHVLGVTVGTGVGGGVLVDGRVVTGRRGAAGHVGHVPVPAAAGLPCPCGATGHVEAVASAPALLARHTARSAAAGSPPAADLAEVSRRAAAGDALAVDVLAEGGRHLGEALAGAVALVSPEAVVVGGGVAGAGALLLDPLREALARHAHPVVADVQVRAAALGPDAVAVGAALRALEAAG